MLENEKHFDIENLVDEALKSEPQYLLSANFADLVAEKVSRKFAWTQYLKEFFIYLGVAVSILIGIAAFSLFWFKTDWTIWLAFVSANLGIVIGITIILTFILFADRVLLRYFMFKSKIETT